MMTEQQSPAPNPAEMYEHMLVKFVFDPLCERILETTAPGPGDRVLDIATGTGIVLRKVAERDASASQLAGVDMSPGMLAVGSSVAQAEGLDIDWYEGDAAQLPLPDGSFDWAFCQHGLQFFPDRGAALREFRRVLDDGGRAVISVWQGMDQHCFARIINDAGYEQVGTQILEVPFSLGSAETLRDLLEGAGFRQVAVEPVTVNARSGDPDRAIRMLVAGGTAAIPDLQGLDDEERASLVDGIVARARPALEQFVVDGELQVDWHANVAIAEK